MEQFTLIKRDGTSINLNSRSPLSAVTSAVQKTTMLGDDQLTLTIKSASIICFEVGDKISVYGDDYYIRTKVNTEIVCDGHYIYNVVLYGVMYELMRSIYRDTDINGKSSKSTFDLTHDMKGFMKVIINNMNRDYPGLWIFDESACPDTDPMTIQFSKQNCLNVLQNLCKAYELEFRIDNINGVRNLIIGEFGEVVNPPNGSSFFQYGRGYGLYKLKEQKVDDKSIITRLWIEGGTKNIKVDYREYSERLQLPLYRINQYEHTLSDGSIIQANSEYIGITDETKTYFEDADLKAEIGSIEDVQHFEDIYPHRTGEVTSLGDDIYTFVDVSMDFDLNEKEPNGNTLYLIAGTNAKITFITGKLAGQEFELKDKVGYNHTDKSFSLIKYTDERGVEFPNQDNDSFRISVGDKFVITDINLPQQYIDKAEEDLWYAGYCSFLDKKQMRAQYVLTLDQSYFDRYLANDSTVKFFNIGDYIPIKDTRFGIEKNIRIQTVQRNLLEKNSYTLTISDITTVSIQSQIVDSVLDHNRIIDLNNLTNIQRAKKAWRTTEELRNMVFDVDGYFDTNNIKVNSIDTNMLTVGSKSQQFVLNGVVLQANVNGLPNQFYASAGYLNHLTIDDNIRSWQLTSAAVALDNSEGYYVYAKCSKSTEGAVFYITQSQLKVEDESDPYNYYFQIGIIGSLGEGEAFRDFITTYGFSRINGGTVTTGKIAAANGDTYFDLDKGEIGGNIKFKSSPDWQAVQNEIDAANKLSSGSNILKNSYFGNKALSPGGSLLLNLEENIDADIAYSIYIKGTFINNMWCYLDIDGEEYENIIIPDANNEIVCIYISGTEGDAVRIVNEGNVNAIVDWVCIFKGDVKTPVDWTPTNKELLTSFDNIIADSLSLNIASSTTNKWNYKILTDLKPDTLYTFSANVTTSNGASAFIRVCDFDAVHDLYPINSVLFQSGKRSSVTFRTPVTGNYSLILYSGQGGFTQNISAQFTNLFLQNYHKATQYNKRDPYKIAFGDTTEIIGGAIFTSIIGFQNGDVVTGGVNGRDYSSDGSNPALWFGGDYSDARIEEVMSLIRHNGSGFFAGGKFWWDAFGKFGVGIFNVTDDSITVDTQLGMKIQITNKSINDFDGVGLQCKSNIKEIIEAGDENILFQDYVVRLPLTQGSVYFYDFTNVMVTCSALPATSSLIKGRAKCHVSIREYDSVTGGQTLDSKSITTETPTITLSDTYIKSNESGTYNCVGDNGFIEIRVSNIEIFRGSINIEIGKVSIGKQGDFNRCIIAKDGMMISSGINQRFMIRPTENSLSIVADMPSYSEDLQTGQLWVDEAGLVRQKMYGDDKLAVLKVGSTYKSSSGSPRQTVSFNEFAGVQIP